MWIEIIYARYQPITVRPGLFYKEAVRLGVEWVCAQQCKRDAFHEVPPTLRVRGRSEGSGGTNQRENPAGAFTPASSRKVSAYWGGAVDGFTPSVLSDSMSWPRISPEVLAVVWTLA